MNKIEERIMETSFRSSRAIQTIIELTVGVTILNEIINMEMGEDNLHKELLNRIGGC